jgi:hypothetical protein
MDLSSYNLNNRPSPLTNSQGHITPEVARKFHSAYQTAVGTDQSNFSPSVAVKGVMQDDPPYLAVSDTYLDFVRSGLITVSYGKLDALSEDKATITPSNDDINDIAAVVLATGFDASASLSFFPTSIHETLSLSPTDQSNTVALAFHGTHHPSIPNLGFVGFYRSPYWGVMEMQARVLQTLWSPSPSPLSLQAALDADTSIQRTLSLRSDPRASQFPMGDYAFLMQELASALGIERLPPAGETPALPPAGKGMDVLTPARYPSKNLTAEQEAEVRKSLADTHSTLVASLSKGRFVARAVFRSLLGEWKLSRRIASQLPSLPSGTFTGTAKFLLRDGTADGRGAETGGTEDDLGMEYLYVEDGEFKADNGLCFRATRRYVYRYDEGKDSLSVWFVRTDDQKRADYLFHEVEFVVPQPDEEEDGRGWRAKSGHLCIDDYYDVGYEFRFAAVNLREWRCAYSVKGPKKDYTIDGTYRR